MIISRIGSIFIEPILRKSKIVKFSDYEKFISASKRDEKIELFSEINNMYRTFISMFVILLLIVIYEYISEFIPLNDAFKTILGLLVLTFLFLFSYRKQTEYINKRIRSQDDKK
jgi:uncharacterized membrane protein